jgi:ribonuclease HI
MNFELFKMDIIDESDTTFKIIISKENESSLISFSPKTKELLYLDSNKLSEILKLREFQLRKLLHNKQADSFFKGFSLNFVLHDGLPDVSFYDKSRITVIDNSSNKYCVHKTKNKQKNIIELFTDGSYNRERKSGAFAIVIKQEDKELVICQEQTNGEGNNLIELLAVNYGLDKLKEHNKIRIITDSQYVIKGASEWLPLWKLNKFVTANGTKAKNIDEWENFDALIKNKYIEFEWVKSHSDHFENSICHLKAKSLTSK